MKNINLGSKALLQSGAHFGVILEDEMQYSSFEWRMIVGFLDSTICLEYTLDIRDPRHRANYVALVRPRVDGELNMDLIGQERLFDVELSVLSTSRGDVGVNTIVGVLPHDSREVVNFFLRPQVAA